MHVTFFNNRKELSKASNIQESDCWCNHKPVSIQNEEWK